MSNLFIAISSLSWVGDRHIGRCIHDEGNKRTQHASRAEAAGKLQNGTESEQESEQYAPLIAQL
jgi:hypothetical protein